jgi:hypothetical protein
LGIYQQVQKIQLLRQQKQNKNSKKFWQFFSHLEQCWALLRLLGCIIKPPGSNFSFYIHSTHYIAILSSFGLENDHFISAFYKKCHFVVIMA